METRWALSLVHLKAERTVMSWQADLMAKMKVWKLALHLAAMLANGGHQRAGYLD